LQIVSISSYSNEVVCIYIFLTTMISWQLVEVGCARVS
jgi:hypothetical protein